MPKPAKKKKSKPQKEITIALNKPMSFDELVGEIVTVKPPKSEPTDGKPANIQ